MFVEMISCPISTKDGCRTGGPNPRPCAYQAEAHPTELAGPTVVRRGKTEEKKQETTKCEQTSRWWNRNNSHKNIDRRRFSKVLRIFCRVKLSNMSWHTMHRLYILVSLVNSILLWSCKRTNIVLNFESQKWSPLVLCHPEIFVRLENYVPLPSRINIFRKDNDIAGGFCMDIWFNDKVLAI